MWPNDAQAHHPHRKIHGELNFPRDGLWGWWCKSVTVSSAGTWRCRTAVPLYPEVHTHTQINEITHLSYLTKRFTLTATFKLGEKTGKQNPQCEDVRKNELIEFHIVLAVESFIKLLKNTLLWVHFKTIYLQTQREHFEWENHSNCAPAKQQVYASWKANTTFFLTKLVLQNSCTQMEASKWHWDSDLLWTSCFQSLERKICKLTRPNFMEAMTAHHLFGTWLYFAVYWWTVLQYNQNLYY